MRLRELLDVGVLQRLTEANYKASGMPIGIIDATDGSALVSHGWQEICLLFHRVNALTLERCRESDRHIQDHLSDQAPCEYTCRNGLRDIGVPILVEGEHLATLFLGQFFYEGEAPDREFFVSQAREVGFDEGPYLAALERVPVFSRSAVENILQYNQALARFISDLAERAVARHRVEERLREADRRKTEFLAALSHELRNPLAPIQNSLYLLERAGPHGDQGRRALAVANRQLRHLTTMVDELLDVLRLSRGKLRLDRRRVDLSRLVREAVEDHASIFVNRGVELRLEEADEPIWVDGDAMRLSQAIGNLLRNAHKFTDAGGHALVRVVRGERDAVIHVRDDGVGIAPELMDGIFEPFVQAEKTLARARGGLGLGLSLVKELVLAHAGTVTARSDGEGKGAELVVTLPLAPAETF